MKNYIWEARNNDLNERIINQISEKSSLSRLVSKVLISRGIKENEEVDKFINFTLEEQNDPFLLNDMERAVERIIIAIENSERVLIFGDYDVDGVTSTFVVCDFLKQLGVKLSYYIPKRNDEGYGLSEKAIKKILEDPVDLLITVDCGITSVNEVEELNKKGIDVIITDHHECQSVLPNAYAIINPTREDSKYPFRFLAGVGVAYKLVQAICIKMGLNDKFLDYLEIVALGTIADVAPIIEENRIIVKYGMERLRNTQNLGICALINSNSIEKEKLSLVNVAYILAPRINAAGRLDDARIAVELLMAENEDIARNIALELNEYNKKRQEIEQEILEQALEKIEKNKLLDYKKILVIWGEGWNDGVVGIVASKIVEKFCRPCILFTVENDTAKGSARSIPGFNITKAIEQFSDILIKFGGHELAAGLSIDLSNIELFDEKINRYADEVLSEKDFMPKLIYDCEVEKNEISLYSVKELDKISPFGVGNPEPFFLVKDLVVKDVFMIGKDKHIRVIFGETGTEFDSIGFNMNEYYGILKKGQKIDIITSLGVDNWTGTEKVKFFLKDIAVKEGDSSGAFSILDKVINVEHEFIDDEKRSLFIDNLKKILCKIHNVKIWDFLPKRIDLENVYKYLSYYEKRGIMQHNIISASISISKIYKISMNYFKFKRCIEVFEELNLLRKKYINEYNVEISFQKTEKVRLEDSKLYVRFLDILKDDI